jgi:predicted alpha-1,2-mannosidase
MVRAMRTPIPIALAALTALVAQACGTSTTAEPAEGDAQPDAAAPIVDARRDSAPTPPDLMPSADAAGPLADVTGPEPDARPDAASPPVDPGPVNDVEAALDTANLFLGTAGIGFAYAALTPAAQWPLGMVSLGPDTSNARARPVFHHFSGYHFDDADVMGFSHTHFIGTGVPDFGNFRFLPASVAEVEAGSVAADLRPLLERFEGMDKATETASPGRYGVRLPALGVTVDLTTSLHAGLQRYTFESGGPAAIVLNATSDASGEGGAREGRVTRHADGAGVSAEILFGGSYTGRSPFRFHLDTAFDPPPSRIVLVGADGTPQALAEFAEGVPSGAIAVWDALPEEHPVVEVRSGLSWVDAAQAELHRESELEGRDFEAVAADARAAWADKLRRVRVAGGTPEQRRIFLTSQYNAYRMPTRIAGADGRYMGFDQQVHVAEDFGYVTNLSLWDTFRTLHPWYSLTDHDTQRDCLRSLMAMGEQGGYIPRWPAGIGYTNGMIGTSADVVFADAAVKGVEGVDYAVAYERLLLTANGPTTPGHRFSGREAITEYLEYGYIPEDATDDSVSKTVEYANNDNALAYLAAFLGRDADAAEFHRRAGFWRNLYNAEWGFLFPKSRDGVSRPVAPQNHAAPYTEGTAWQWTFFVPQDPAGLADAFGGPAPFGEKLESLFALSKLGQSMGPVRNTFPDSYYWHGNEPVIQAGYLFGYSDRPARGHFWLREIQTRLYGDAPDGLAGNDDGGTLSSWYLFSALGLYPVAGTPDYVLGTPLFPRAEVDLAGGGVLRIEAPGADLERRYVRRVTWNGEAVVGPTIDHMRLSAGGTLAFEMSATPD